MAFDGRDETSLNRGNDRQRHAAKFAILDNVNVVPADCGKKCVKSQILHSAHFVSEPAPPAGRYRLEDR